MSVFSYQNGTKVYFVAFMIESSILHPRYYTFYMSFKTLIAELLENAYVLIF